MILPVSYLMHPLLNTKLIEDTSSYENSAGKGLSLPHLATSSQSASIPKKSAIAPQVCEYTSLTLIGA